MSYNIPSSTKILTLATAPFLFILIGVRSLHFNVPPVRSALFFLWAQLYTLSSTFIKKISTFVCHYIIMARSLLNWKKTKSLTVFMVLII